MENGENVTEAAEESMQSLAVLVLKYFAHGIPFSLLAVGMLFVAQDFLIMLGPLGFDGILIILAMLYSFPMVIGVANSLITGFLWFPVEYSWFGTWVHGGLLFMVLLAIGVIISLPLLSIPQLASIVISFIVGAFVDGFIGKQIATIWETVKDEET